MHNLAVHDRNYSYRSITERGTLGGTIYTVYCMHSLAENDHNYTAIAISHRAVRPGVQSAYRRTTTTVCAYCQDYYHNGLPLLHHHSAFHQIQPISGHTHINTASTADWSRVLRQSITNQSADTQYIQEGEDMLQ